MDKKNKRLHNIYKKNGKKIKKTQKAVEFGSKGVSAFLENHITVR